MPSTATHWSRIIEHKHPIMRSRLNLVRQASAAPAQVRRSRTDAHVHLYYCVKPRTPYPVCVVARHLNGDGFITAYRTDRIKEGEPVWMP